MSIHVVSKENNAVTATFEFNDPLPILGESSIRVKTKLIALTSNNLSYARAGTFLHWWDIYPVPSTAPTPYNDESRWGIVPAWGYGEVIESNIAAIPVKSRLYGFWPTSSYPVDVQLKAWDIPGYWDAVEDKRKEVMTVYNRYIQSEPSISPKDEALVGGMQAVWQCAYLLNASTFPDKKGVTPIHPLGFGHPWTESDADLSASVVISLSAASKTARSLAWNFARNRDLSVNGPLGLLQATTATSSLVDFSNSPFKFLNVSYKELATPNTLDWIAKLNPSRVVIIDFGAAASMLQNIHTAVKKQFPNLVISTLAVGNESKVFTPEELSASQADFAQFNKVQVNTSTLIDRAIEADGSPAKWFDEMKNAWARYIREGGMGNMEVIWKEGVAGSDGIEGTWQKVCEGKIPGDQCVAVKL